MKCKNCEINDAVKYSKYSTGEFCSRECARAYSTKEKRGEINEKISKKLIGIKFTEAHKINISKGRKFGKHSSLSEETKKKISIAMKCRTGKFDSLYKICENCKKEYLAGNKNTKRANNRKFCSKDCFYIVNSSKNNREHMSNLMCERAMRGLINNKGTKCKYIFNDSVIFCDSKIEYACLNFFEVNYDVINIERCNIRINYEYENKERKYNPDFLIETKSGIFIVECKTIIKNKFLNEKWRKYNEISIIKKKKLEEFAIENKISSFWFTKNLHRKFYNSLKF